jgi:U3 small nucleolar RNA-associated protein 5
MRGSCFLHVRQRCKHKSWLANVNVLCVTHQPQHTHIQRQTNTHHNIYYSHCSNPLCAQVSGALKQQFFEDDHLTANYTCLALVEPNVQTRNDKQTPKQKKRKVAAAAGASLAALGNTRGKIIVWDLTAGQVVHRLQADTNHINDLAFSPDGKRLYACSAGSTVDAWDLKSGELAKRLEADKNGVKRICISADGSQLLSASSTIKLWDLKSSKRLHRYAGHHSQVTALAFVPGKPYFVSGGGDRFVSVWRLDAAGTKTKTPVALLSLQHNASGLAVMGGSVLEEDDGALMLAVVTNADKAYVWRVEGDVLQTQQKARNAAQPEKPKCELVLQKELSTAGSRMMGVFVSGSGRSVLLAHGTGTRPVFESAE